MQLTLGCTFAQHQLEMTMHEIVSTHPSNDKAYTGHVAPSLRQAPFQSIAAQIQLLQLHQQHCFTK